MGKKEYEIQLPLHKEEHLQNLKVKILISTGQELPLKEKKNIFLLKFL